MFACLGFVVFVVLSEPSDLHALVSVLSLTDVPNQFFVYLFTVSEICWRQGWVFFFYVAQDGPEFLDLVLQSPGLQL